ncbi:dipicolinate synthase subunit B [Bacillus sp. NRRL B-14911]|nr:dipicolinate synthase subunit B [Bacillus sp. NRRL B-14911]
MLYYNKNGGGEEINSCRPLILPVKEKAA